MVACATCSLECISTFPSSVPVESTELPESYDLECNYLRYVPSRGVSHQSNVRSDWCFPSAVYRSIQGRDGHVDYGAA